jgi:FkbM family methyltransferase
MWEELPRRLFADVARTARTVVDCGAYSGIYSLIALASSQNSRVHSFEPLSTNFERTRTNLEINPMFHGRWHLHKQALGKTNRLDFIHFEPRGTNDTASLQAGYRTSSTSQEPVDVVTLDSLNLHDVDLIKIDAEQHDHFVIAGASKLLSQHQPVVFFEAHNNEFLQVCRHELAACGYWATSLIDQKKFIHVAIGGLNSPEAHGGNRLIRHHVESLKLPITTLN